MKYSVKSAVSGKMILANDHYAAIPYDCSELKSLAADGVIPAGTVIPANDETARGVLLSDVRLDENPNGTIAVHGFVRLDRLPKEPSEAAKSAIKLVEFV